MRDEEGTEVTGKEGINDGSPEGQLTAAGVELGWFCAPSSDHSLDGLTSRDFPIYQLPKLPQHIFLHFLALFLSIHDSNVFSL